LKNIDNLCAFIISTLNRDEQLYLAAQIHLNAYSIRDTTLPLVELEENKAPAVVEQNLESSATIEKNVEINPTVVVNEHVSEFQSLNNTPIQYNFIKRNVLQHKPKSIQKLMNCIGNIGKSYGEIKQSDIEIVVAQLKADDIFQIIEGDDLMWIK